MVKEEKKTADLAAGGVILEKKTADEGARKARLGAYEDLLKKAKK